MSFADILQSLDSRERDKLWLKVPSWTGLDIHVPRALNFQQCSSEQTAVYKASLVPEGVRVADLTGGLGVDSWAFSRRASAVWYNERDAVLREAVEHNFAVLGVENTCFNSFDISSLTTEWFDSLRSFVPDVVYLDPARRDSAGRKVFLLEDCSPDVVSLMPSLLDIAPLVMVKVSPMADITMLRRRLSPWLSELHVVGAKGECKELLCLCRRDAVFCGIVLAEDGVVFSGSCCTAQEMPLETSASLHPSHCASLVGPSRLYETKFPPIVPKGTSALRGDHGRSRSPEASPASVSQEPAEELLFVPSAAMVKSGLGPGMAMLTYDEHLSHFGKFYQVIEPLPFASSVLKDLSKRWPQAEVTARGVHLSSEELRKKIRTKPGGPVHIFACVLEGARRLLVCRPFEKT